MMNSDQVKGAAEKTGGKVKEEFGKITGNPDTQAKGKFDQAKGQAREKVGDAKEALKGNK
ncbi:MAG TPA: CsbD family protein [Edaphobacter sp.]|nr:CsbD family protein [Edaphobacter sp.]